MAKRKQQDGAGGLPGVLPETKLIALAEIDRGSNNHRLASPESKAEIKKLELDFRERKLQLQPVRVYRKPGENDQPYLLGFGFRRCAAAELAGWTHIRAEIYPWPDDLMPIEQDRAIENLRRQNLTPMEEAVAVMQMLELAKGQNNPTAHVAALLGATETWVRDRMYLMRLGPQTRQRVVDGKLLLGYARVIAMLGDHDLQERVAEECKVQEDGHIWRSLSQIRRQVEFHQKSLRGVSWVLEDAFDGVKNKAIVGACATCPHNSATDANLFEHDEKRPESGVCLNAKCFEAKQAVTQDALDKAVKKIVNSNLPTNATAAESCGASFVKPASIVRKVKAERESKAVPKDASSAPKPVKEDPQKVAQGKLYEAEREWADNLREQLVDAASGDAWKLIAMMLLDRIIPWGAKVEKHEKEIALAGKADAASICNLGIILGGERHEVENLLNFEPEFAVAIGSLWGINVAPRPTIKQFLPAAKATIVDDGPASWRDLRVADLGFPLLVNTWCAERDVATAGELADAIAEDDLVTSGDFTKAQLTRVRKKLEELQPRK